MINTFFVFVVFVVFRISIPRLILLGDGGARQTADAWCTCKCNGKMECYHTTQLDSYAAVVFPRHGLFLKTALSTLTSHYVVMVVLVLVIVTYNDELWLGCLV